MTTRVGELWTSLCVASVLAVLILSGCSIEVERSGPAQASAEPPASPVDGPCAFTGAPQIQVDEPGSFLQFWLEEDRPELHAPTLPDVPSLHAFRDQIAALLDTDARAILERQGEEVTGADADHVRAVLAGEVGTIRSMSCIEGLLLAAQTDRAVALGTSMYTDPTEFVGYQLSRGDSLKIWFYTVDMPGVRGLGTLHDPVAADLADGWSMERNIHNHNFFPEGEMILGGVVPSATDVQLFGNVREALDLTRASVTNGFDTIDLTEEDIRRLSGG